MSQKSAVPFAVFILLALDGLAGAAITDFGGAGGEATAVLDPPSFTATVNLSLPADCVVLSAKMSVRGLAAEGCLTAYPADPSVSLDGTTLWSFGGTGAGAPGRQTVLSNGMESATVVFGPGGGSQNLTIRLPKNATVESATAALDCTRPGVHPREAAHFSGEVNGDQMGRGTAFAGDVNGDGQGDLIAGTPYNDAAGRNFGRAYIFFGGGGMNTTADVTINGVASDQYFAFALAGAGDVNGDGYDDVLVGANANQSAGAMTGAAYLYYGGAPMDGKADIVFTGAAWYNSFGSALAGAGDVNGDGYDDVIITAPGNTSGGPDAGRAYIYLGGAAMNNGADIILTGTGVDRNFGCSVDSAGDVNADGFDDVVVGEYYFNAPGAPAGRASVFLGGRSMDNTADFVFRGTSSRDNFGLSVSGAGDVNSDGWDDVIVGAPQVDSGATDNGAAYVYFGGARMNTTADLILHGPTAYSGYFGWTVSEGGDLDRDGYDDVLVMDSNRDVNGSVWGAVNVFFGGARMNTNVDARIQGQHSGEGLGIAMAGAGDIDRDGYMDFAAGAPLCGADGGTRGRAYIYSLFSPVSAPAVKLGSAVLFTCKTLEGSAAVANFAVALNAYLADAPTSGTDAWGNAFADAVLNVSAESDGNITLRGIRITYRYDAAVPDFSGALNSYIAAHRGEAGEGENLTVPLSLKSSGPGRLVLSALRIDIDRPPAMMPPIPDLWMDEDSENTTLLDLRAHFADDRDAPGDLAFWLLSATNSSFVNLSVRDNRYLSADALGGAGNDNWTGVVEAQVGCRDSRNLSRLSNPFNLTIRNLNDPPLITSAPPAAAMFRKDLAYAVTAVDGDRDALVFSLENPPAGMAIDRATGAVTWLPGALGRMNVSISVSDGAATAWQNFTVTVSSNPDNRAPRFISQPPQNATAGSAYSYDADALDDDADPLVYSLREAPAGMAIDGASGRITWTPAAAGTFAVSVAATDGQSNAYQDFALAVREGGENRAPRFLTAAPRNASVGQEYAYAPSAVDDDGDNLTFSLVSGPAGMTVNETSGRIVWVPQSGQAGAHNITIAVSDEHGLRAEQSFTVEVSAGNGARPDCAITSPVHLEKVRGRLTLKGTAAAGLARVTRVDVRIDGGEWVKASGTESWSFTVDTRQLRNGLHRFEVRSYDDMLFSDTAAVEVTVSNSRAAPAPDNTLLIYAVVAMALGAAAVSVMVIAKRKKAKEPAAQYPQAGAYAPQYQPAQPYGGAPVQWSPQPVQPGPAPPLPPQQPGMGPPPPAQPQTGPVPPQMPPAIPPPEG